jgi:hypothetical protein
MFFKLEKGLDIGKRIANRFLCGRPNTAMTPAQSTVRSRPTLSASSGLCQAGPVPREPHTSASLIRGWEPLGTRPDTTPVTAQTHPLPHLRHRRSSPAKFPSLSHPRIAFFMTHRRLSHLLLPRAVISCVDSLRRHLPAQPLVLVGATAGHHDSDQTATRASGQGCLVLPRPILSLLANDCGPYRHHPSAAPSPFRCSVVSSLYGRDAGARSSTVMPRTAPLLPPPLLTPRAARLASSSLASRRVGTMRWHANARRVALSSATPVQRT